MSGYAHTIAATLKDLSEKFEIETFIETGTFNGCTTDIASQIFKRVYTIEISTELYRKAKEKFAHIEEVHVLLGNSPDILKGLVNEVKEDAIFFLDAHWAGDLSSRGETDTPLLEELEIISQRKNKDIIIVDDVSFFDKKSEHIFNPGSQYFPNGGIFKWDWRHIQRDSVVKNFKDREIVEVDDRLIFTPV